MRRVSVFVVVIAVVVAGCWNSEEPAGTIGPTSTTPEPATSQPTSVVPTTPDTTTARPTTSVTTVTPPPPEPSLRPFPTDVPLTVAPAVIAGSDLPVFMYEVHGGWGVENLLLLWADGRFLRLDQHGLIDDIESLVLIGDELPQPTDRLPMERVQQLLADVEGANLDQLALFEVDLTCPFSDGVIEEFRFRFDGMERSLASCIDDSMAAHPAIAAAADFVSWVSDEMEPAPLGRQLIARARSGEVLAAAAEGGGLYEGTIVGIDPQGGTAATVTVGGLVRLSGEALRAPESIVVDVTQISPSERAAVEAATAGDRAWVVVRASGVPEGMGLFDEQGQLIDAGPDAAVVNLGRIGLVAASAGWWRRQASTCTLDPLHRANPDVTPTAAGGLLVLFNENVLEGRIGAETAAARPRTELRVKVAHGTTKERWHVFATRSSAVLGVLDARPEDLRKVAAMGRPADGEGILVWQLDRLALEGIGCHLNHAWRVPGVVSEHGTLIAEIPWRIIEAGGRPTLHLDTGLVEPAA